MENRIRALREPRHMSQVRLSVELEVSQETVSAYESGKHFPSYKNLVRMSELFGVGIDYLMGRCDKAQPGDGLSRSEQVLLENYRSLDELGRAKAESYLQGLAEQK